MADTDISLSVDLDVQDAEKTAKNLQKEVENIFNTRKGEQSATLTNLEIQMKKNYDAARNLRSAMEELADAPVETDAYKKILEDQQHYLDMKDKLIEQMSAMEEKAEASEAQGAKLYDTEKYQNLVKQMEQTEEALGRLGLAREKMEQDGTAYVLGRETAEYQKQQIQLDSINDKLKQQLVYHNEIEARVSQGGAAQAARDANMEIIAANSSLMAMNMAIRSIGRIIPGVSTAAISGVVMLTRAVLRLTKLTKADLVLAIGKVKAAFASLFAFIMAHPIILLITAIIALITVLIKLIKGLWDETEEQVDELFEMVGDGLKEVSKAAVNFIKILTEGFIKIGDLLPSKLIKLVQTLINKLKSLKSVIKENLDLMAQWNEGNNAVNDALSNITSSLNYLKATLATAVAPILTYIEPVLTHFIDILAEVLNLIGMVIAKMTGATTYQRAIRVQNDYAESLDKTAKAANDAAAGLAGFDKLNVLSSNKGAGGSASTKAVDFKLFNLEDTPLPDWLEDFNKLGKKLGKLAKKFLKNIDWNTIKEKAGDIGTNIAEFINGFFQVPDIGATLGLTIGEGLNTISTLINNFITDLDGVSLGAQLGAALQTMVTTVHWDEVGDMFSGGFNKLVEIIRNFAESFHGEDLGIAFTTFLQNALGDIKWDEVKITIGKVVEDIAGFFNEVITPENFNLIGTTLANVLNTILTGIDVFVSKAEWEQWGDSVAEGIMSFITEADFKKAGENVGNVVEGLLDMLGTAINKLTDPNNIDIIIQKILDFFENVPWDRIREKASAISQKLRDGLTKIWEALKESGAYDEIIKFIVEFLQEKENWEKLFAGFKDDVVGDIFWKQIKGIFDSVGKHIANAINTLIDFIADCFNNIGNFLGALNPFSDTTWEDYLNGKKPGSGGRGISKVSAPKIEGYANGAVLPPNKPFLGILGDQKNGTNVEAPLSTIQKAVADVMGNMGIKVVFDVKGDPNGLFKAVQKEATVYYKQTGANAFA